MADEGFQILGVSDSSLASSLYHNLEKFPGQVFTTPPLMSAKEQTRRSRSQIVRAARHVERSSEPIRGGIDSKVDMVVGARLKVAATPDWDTLGVTDKKQQRKVRKAFEREFNNWAYDKRMLQDAEGHYDFGGLMWLGMRHITGPDGEVFGAIQYDEARARAYRHRWATFVQIFDPDRVDTPPNMVGNPNVEQGRRKDKWGRMVGFYVRKSHPSDATIKPEDMQFQYVPRETAAGRPIGFHWFVKTRAAQIRGVSQLVTILKQNAMLAEFDEAYLGAAIINQMLATWVSSELSSKAVGQSLAPADEHLGYDPYAFFEKKLGYYENNPVRIHGQRIAHLPPGDDIKMEAINRGAQDPGPFRNAFLREFASSIGVSFEQITKNFSDANFSAARAAILDIWRGVIKLRTQFTQHVAILIYRAVLEEAWKKGYLDDVTDLLPDFDEYAAALCECEFIGPQMPQIDPEKEAKADRQRLDSKTVSRKQVIAEKGGDIDETFEQIEEERNDAEARGFSLDEQQQAEQVAEATEPPDGEAAEEDRRKKPAAGPRDADGDGIVDEEEID